MLSLKLKKSLYFPGRFQPLTISHYNIANKLSNDYEVIFLPVRVILPNGEPIINKDYPFLIEEQKEMFELLGQKYEFFLIEPPYIDVLKQKKKFDLVYMGGNNWIKRKVYGYFAKQLIVNNRYNGPSASQVRECYLSNCDLWEKYVPKTIVPYLRNIRELVKTRIKKPNVKTIKIYDFSIPLSLKILRGIFSKKDV